MTESQREQAELAEHAEQAGHAEQAPEEEAAAGHAAEVAADLSEAAGPPDRGRVAGALAKVSRSASRTVTRTAGRTTDAARRTTDAARRGTGTARRTTDAARRGVGMAASTFSSTVNWLTGQVLAMAPRLRIRDQATLREQFPGRTDDEIAELLIDRAARASAAVGGATGAWSALPALPAFPAEIAAETLAVTGIEIKLVAELHEAYGMPAPGSGTERARAYIASWANRRGVYWIPGGLVFVAGSPLARQVRRRLATRVRRSTLSLAPLLTGAVAGVMINRRETRKLGNQVRDDLRRPRPA